MRLLTKNSKKSELPSPGRLLALIGKIIGKYDFSIVSSRHQLKTLTEEDLNKREILLNGIPFTTFSLVASLDLLLTGLCVNIKHVEVFPFDIDSYGLPPINCKKILNPLIWMRMEIESKIRKHCQPEGSPINQIATSLKNAPKEGTLKKLAIPSL